jgi:predicted nucleic acid-binding protein
MRAPSWQWYLTKLIAKIYAYDAFYVRCCLETKLPLISLDSRICDVAKDLGIEVVI